MAAKGNTRQEILDAALELFSVQGYEATSISQLADAVGIRKASLYSHFESKQAILDALMQDTLAQYEERSLLVKADEEAMTAEAVAERILGQIRYILHDPQISRGRKMLTIEQFRSPEMAQLQTKQNYTDVMRCFTDLMQQLIRSGTLAAHDPEIMAAQLCLPVSAWLGLCDREPQREDEVTELIGRHVRQFFEIYRAK